MNYLEIFDDVVSITHNDYSGCIDKKGWANPILFRQKLAALQSQDQLSPQVFQQIVEDYLLDFKDGHMYFRLIKGTQKIMDNGFKCRRYEDKLYITYAGKENRLQQGMAVIALDGTPILEIANRHKRELQLRGSTAEREIWEPVLLKYHNCTIMDKMGQIFELNLEKYDVEEYTPEYSLKVLDNGILIMKLTDFNNTDAVIKLLLENQELLETNNNLIIDVRLNNGGSDSAFMKLLRYIFPGETNLNDLDDGSIMQLYMSERNYKLRMDSFTQYLKSLSDPADISFMNTFIRELKKYKDITGLVEIDLKDAIPDMIVKGQKKPENIVVLADLYCGSSGDAFVETAALSEKVTIVGRGTAGITDYSNLAVQEWSNTFALMYPTSRSGKIDIGKGLTGKGIQPDIYIPWTPEHTERDVDLVKAIEHLLSK
jgi:hypothetical protein